MKTVRYLEAITQKDFGRSWVSLGASWGGLGASCGLLGASWEGLGASLGGLGAVLGPLGAVLWALVLHVGVNFATDGRRTKKFPLETN